jgi:hypothetical protein
VGHIPVFATLSETTMLTRRTGATNIQTSIAVNANNTTRVDLPRVASRVNMSGISKSTPLMTPAIMAFVKTNVENTSSSTRAPTAAAHIAPVMLIVIFNKFVAIQRSAKVNLVSTGGGYASYNRSSTKALGLFQVPAGRGVVLPELCSWNRDWHPQSETCQQISLRQQVQLVQCP